MKFITLKYFILILVFLSNILASRINTYSFMNDDFKNQLKDLRLLNQKDRLKVRFNINKSEDEDNDEDEDDLELPNIIKSVKIEEDDDDEDEDEGEDDVNKKEKEFTILHDHSNINVKKEDIEDTHLIENNNNPNNNSENDELIGDMSYYLQSNIDGSDSGGNQEVEASIFINKDEDDDSDMQEIFLDKNNQDLLLKKMALSNREFVSYAIL